MFYSTHIEIRGHLCEFYSLLWPLHVFCGSNLGQVAMLVQQVPLPAKQQTANTHTFISGHVLLLRKHS